MYINGLAARLNVRGEKNLAKMLKNQFVGESDNYSTDNS